MIAKVFFCTLCGISNSFAGHCGVQIDIDLQALYQAACCSCFTQPSACGSSEVTIPEYGPGCHMTIT